jgi:hypothetical protein
MADAVKGEHDGAPCNIRAVYHIFPSVRDTT